MKARDEDVQGFLAAFRRATPLETGVAACWKSENRHWNATGRQDAGSGWPGRSGAVGVRAGFPPARPGMRIGLLGGSFDPPHQSHVHLTRTALKSFGLDAVWWLVTPGNPLKTDGPAPMPRRIAAARAVMQHPRVTVTDIEARLGTRMTADTLKRLTEIYPGVRFVWLMGADNLAQFSQWKDWRAIARLMPIAVMARPGYDADAFASPAMAWLRRYRVDAVRLRNGGEWSAPALIYLRFDPDSRSATAIRRDRPEWDRQIAGPAPRDAITHKLIEHPAHAT